MRKLWNLCMVLLLLSACSTEQESMQQNRIGDGTVTLEEFKLATGMKDFGTTIRIPRRSGGVAARAASMEDFVIDTDFIRKTTIDQKITYSFSIEPKVVKDKESLYNLVVYHRGENWQYVILEMKPGAAKFQALVLGQEIKLDGEIREIYHTDVARGVDCVMFSIENWHCTGTGECADGSCDGCNLCVDYTNFKVCRYDMEDYNSATLVATDNDYGSGGSSPVIHHDYVFTPNFGQGNIRAIRAEWAANFYDVLEQEQQDWADHHENAYYQIVQYYLDHYNTEEAGFAMEILQQSMESGFDLDIEKSLKSPVNIDDSAIDKSTPEGIKFDCIYKKLMTSANFKSLFSDIFNNNNKVAVKFEVANENQINALADTKSKMVNGKQVMTIRISRELLTNANTLGSNVFIAKIIMHECVHAYIQYARVTSVNHPGISIENLNDMSFADCVNDYYDTLGSQAQHNFMIDEFLPNLKAEMSDILNSLITPAEKVQWEAETITDANSGLNEPWSWDSFLENLCMQGLEQTNFFKQNIATFGPNNSTIVAVANPQKLARFQHYVTKAVYASDTCN